MPHIVITAVDTRRNLQGLSLVAELDFSAEYYKNKMRVGKLAEELHEDLKKLTEKYFGDYYESKCSVSDL